LFCFCAPRKDNDKPMFIIAFFLFCFCAPISNNYKPCLSLVHHCFHSMWIPQKMIKGPLFFFFFLWTTNDEELAKLVIVFYSFDGLQTMTSCLGSSLFFFVVEKVGNTC
jgi:hypothetical protein